MRRFTVLVVGAIAALGLAIPTTAGAAPAPLQVTTASLPSVYQNVRYPLTILKATGGTKPYVWSVAAGALPYGFKLSSGGVLSGASGVSGTYDITLRVTDKTHSTAERAYEIVVKPMMITTASLKNAKRGQFYFASLKSVGGCSSPKWSVERPSYEGALPTGLKLGSNGGISGVPKLAGTSTFTVIAECYYNPLVDYYAIKSFTITVT